MKPPIQIGRISDLEVIGRSAARAKPPVVENRDAKQESAEILVADPKDEWSDEPTVGDQYTNERYAGTAKEGPTTYAVYTLSGAENDDTTSLNKLMAQADPPEAPRIILVGQKESYNEEKDHYKIMVMYRRIRYKKLITKIVPKTHE